MLGRGSFGAQFSAGVVEVIQGNRILGHTPIVSGFHDASITCRYALSRSGESRLLSGSGRG